MIPSSVGNLWVERSLKTCGKKRWSFANNYPLFCWAKTALRVGLLLVRHAIKFVQLFFGEFGRLHHALRNDESHCETKCKNGKYRKHDLRSLSDFDARGENDHPHTHPQAENAGHPDAYENAVFVAYQEPKRHACHEADKSADEEGVVNFVKHDSGLS